MIDKSQTKVNSTSFLPSHDTRINEGVVGNIKRKANLLEDNIVNVEMVCQQMKPTCKLGLCHFYSE